ncbi:EamA domain-containing membrane protein RarD [Enhydrobacter aerosaccus]|uniref:EamA domain-containing membrane protein RarD n=2 Tax=Enhydrobacter aerosaccus TaxID=225324 RepID=A0A1T4L4R2_9HYPH|nr:EamA domain-containing membrane protein RarD [Enhydrobacter aerosaccus]
MGIACALFPIMNGLVKLLSASYHFEEVVWARVVSHLVLIVLIFLPRRGWALFRTRQPISQFICSMTLLASTFFFFGAVKYVGVAEAIAISFIAPLAVVFLAWPLLGERITAMRLAAVAVGFTGVLIVIRPGSSVFQWASLMIVASAIAYAIYQIFIRRVAGLDHPSTTVFYSAFGSTIVMSLVVPFVWRTPDNLKDALLLSSLGLFGGIGHYCVARAMTYAPANFIAPFNYTQMIGSVIVGYMLFDEIPDLYTWIGSAVIIAAGLMVGLRSRAKPKT